MKNGKDIGERIKRLETDLSNLEQSISDFQKSNDEIYLLNIAANLSALVCINGSSMHPLLLDLAEDLNIPLGIFSIPQKGDKPNQKLLLSLVGERTWNTKPEKRWVKYSLNDWMQIPFYHSNGSKEYRSRNQILQNISYNEAETSQPLSKQLNYDDMLSALFDISQAVLWLGSRLLLITKLRDLSQANFLSADVVEQESNRILYSINLLDKKFERPKVDNIFRNKG